MVDAADNDETEISIDLAHREFERTGDSLGIKVGVEDLGRIAAQTAKQVIIQKIRDAEREMTNEFKEPHYRIVRRFEKGNIVDLAMEAILPKREQVQTETYRQGDRIQAYVLDITRASRSPQVVLSRTHPGLLMKLFEPRGSRDLRGHRPNRGVPQPDTAPSCLKHGSRCRSSRRLRRAQGLARSGGRSRASR